MTNLKMLLGKLQTTEIDMQNLKNNLIKILIALFIQGCAISPKYEITTYPPKGKYDHELHVIKIDPRRITHQCVDFRTNEENNWRYHYFIYILNTENKVIETANPTDQDIDSCTEHLKKVEKIFKNQESVNLCIRGQLHASEFPDTFFDFKDLGKFPSGYRQPEFDSICNSTECFSLNEIWTTTCPGFVKHQRESSK